MLALSEMSREVEHLYGKPYKKQKTRSLPWPWKHVASESSGPWCLFWFYVYDATHVYVTCRRYSFDIIVHHALISDSSNCPSRVANQVLIRSSQELSFSVLGCDIARLTNCKIILTLGAMLIAIPFCKFPAPSLPIHLYAELSTFEKGYCLW